MEKVFVFLALTLFLTSFVFASPGMFPGTSMAVEENKIEGEGTIEYVGVEGGCWRIVHDGKNYEPVNLNSDFRVDGMKVDFKAMPATNLASICQVGTLITLSEIESKDDDDEIRERVREETRTMTNSEGEQTQVRVRVEREVEIEDGKTKITIKKKYTYENGTEVEVRISIVTEGTTQKFRFEGQSNTEEDDIEVEIEEELEIEDVVSGNQTRIRARLSNGEFSNIDVLPDRVRKRVRERLRIRNISNMSIQLRERLHQNVPQVVYNVQTNEHGRFLGIFKLAMKYEANVDPETGEILDTEKPWWAFLVVRPAE